MGTATIVPENEKQVATLSPTQTNTIQKTNPQQSPTVGKTKTATATPQKKTPTNKPVSSATSTVTPDPDGWKKLPVVPEISQAVVKIYQRGLELGNNKNAFSKIGDCGSTPSWFLGDFDRGSRYYRLGDYEHLQQVVDYYAGSFERTSLAARSGFNASALFTPLWADPKYCEPDETPLECEYRNHRPVIAFVTLGANDVWHPGEFEPQMRKIIEFLTDNGVIPIMATKPDNQEGDGLINRTIAELANEYQIPLWNFWAATYPLPDHGLQEDGVHLTFAPNYFDDPSAMNTAWTMRNLTALQMLDAIWKTLNPKQLK